MTKDLLESVRLLAFYRAMKSNGFANGDSFRIIYRTIEYKLQRIPAFIRKDLGRLQMTAFFKRPASSCFRSGTAARSIPATSPSRS